MKTAVLVLSLLFLVPSPPAWARHHHGFGGVSCCGGCDSPVFWARRCSSAGGRFAISSERKSVDLLIDRREVVLQLSDRTMHRIDRELRHERDDEDGFFAGAIKNAVLEGVRELLDHSLRCPLDEVRDAEYRHGRLILTTRDGDELFRHVEVEDDDVMESFAASDARAFVAEFRRLKGYGS